MWIVFIRTESLAFLIDKEQEVRAYDLFKRVYRISSEEEFENDWELTKGRRGLEISVKEQEDKPSLITIFKDRKYRSGSVFLIFAAAIAQCTGINAINIYSSTILLQIPAIPTTLGTYVLSLANVIGALLALGMVKFFSIRQLLVYG